MIVYCATGNHGKLREFRLAGETYGGRSVQVVALPGLPDIPPPDETGSTFEENATLKALYYARHTEGWIFADDSGLEVDAIAGEPGVRSARFAGPTASDRANNELLLERLGDHRDRAAQFVCVIALARHGRLIRTFRGVVRGRILEEPRGVGGFGYDPLFFYEPFGCTFGEASSESKMRVSHRAQALREMFAWLSEQ